MVSWARFTIVGLLLLSSLAAADDGSGIEMSIAGDIVGDFGESPMVTSPNRIGVREAEILFFAPIDPLFDGLMSAAAHEEGGVYQFEIHELYLGSSRLIPRSRFRVGQFFLGFGRLNRFHRHDWPFISAPLVQRNFFHQEAARDTGIEYSWLADLPFYLDLTLGLTSGWTFGHSHSLGSPPLLPTHYLRAATFVESILGDGKAEIGLNYVGRQDSAGLGTYFGGLDLTAKWRNGQTLSFLLQSETWVRLTRHAAGTNEDALGFYVFPQIGLSPQWYVGMRFDGYSILSRTGGNFAFALVPQITFKASEFSTIRAAYQWGHTRRDGSTLDYDKLIQVQAVFLLGSHPAHEF